MIYICNIRTVRAALGAALLTLVAACSDVPSGPVYTNVPNRAKTATDDHEVVERVTISSKLQQAADTTLSSQARRWSTTSRGGISTLAAPELGLPADPSFPPVPLKVWDRGRPTLAGVRNPRLSLRLPNGQVAIVERDFSADGVPVSMRVSVGGDEFRWQRRWSRQGDRFNLSEAVIESHHNGVLVSRRVVSIMSSPRAMTSGRFPIRAHLLAYARRFGSLAGAVLLPRVLAAQSDAGKACDGSSTSLKAAWLGWRVATVSWTIALAFGDAATILKTTTAIFAASATVEVAEANYIDCYVAAAHAGVPDGSIARPPVMDDL